MGLESVCLAGAVEECEVGNQGPQQGGEQDRSFPLQALTGRLSSPFWHLPSIRAPLCQGLACHLLATPK